MIRVRFSPRRTELPLWLSCLYVVLVTASTHAQIKDVLRSAEIDTLLARGKQGEHTFHTQSNFAMLGGVREGPALAPETHKDAGTFKQPHMPRLGYILLKVWTE